MKIVSKAEFIERLRKLSEPIERSPQDSKHEFDPLFGQGNIVGTLDIARLNAADSVQ